MENESAIKILHLEDNPSDAQLVQTILKKANIKFDYFFADNEKDYRSILETQEIDLILSDYHLPDYSGSDALTYAKNYYPIIPFVFISGAMGEDAAIESMLNGATDYVLKNKMERLVPAVHRAFKEAQEMKARLKAEKELKKISRAVEQSSNSIIITDTDGAIEYANPTTLRITGYTNAELIGKNPRIFSSGEKSKEEYAQLWETISSGNVWEGEFHNKKKNGQLYWESASISPIIANNGTISNYMAIKVDVSDRKKLIEELIKAKDQAEESDRLKTSFLHNISHEIRTPMNAIIGFSGFLIDPDLNHEKRKYFIDIIGQSCNQLLSIISDIVSIATIEAGQEKIVEKEIDLNSALVLLQQQFLLKAKTQNISLIIESFSSENDVKLYSDETKLMQILSNLIGNALKFTKQGSVTFGFSVLEKDLEFYVKDTGIGISPEMHKVIFERFRQVESTSTRQFGGSGLGLSISKAYVELLGGKIWLISEPGKGSTFFFTIPHKIREKKSIPETEYEDHKIIDSEASKTILVAEDEDSNFMLLEELLQVLNVTVIRAINGLEAVEICKSGKNIDLVLMDIKMPIMDGYEATKQIRTMRPYLPVVAQTAYSEETEKHKAIACGCNDFITKPFKKDILIAKVRKQLYK
jgi:PAS domain S-box-containing protein